MSITVNEGGTLCELDSVYANEGGTLCELDSVYANESGVISTIFSCNPQDIYEFFSTLGYYSDASNEPQAYVEGSFTLLKPTTVTLSIDNIYIASNEYTVAQRYWVFITGDDGSILLQVGRSDYLLGNTASAVLDAGTYSINCVGFSMEVKQGISSTYGSSFDWSVTFT